MIKRYTVLDILKLKPCQGYDTVEKIKYLLPPRRTRLSLLEILELNVSALDKLWLGSRLLPVRFVRELVVDCVESGFPAADWCGAIYDKRMRRCIDMVRKYLDGHATLKELSCAASAAASAARDVYVTSHGRCNAMYCAAWAVRLAAKTAWVTASEVPNAAWEALVEACRAGVGAPDQVELLRLYAVLAEDSLKEPI